MPHRKYVYGQPVGRIFICSIEVRKLHGKPRLIALWHHQGNTSLHLNESPIIPDNGYHYILTGTERRPVYIPERIMKTAPKIA